MKKKTILVLIVLVVVGTLGNLLYSWTHESNSKFLFGRSENERIMDTVRDIERHGLHK
jgi:hypothetical protein